MPRSPAAVFGLFVAAFLAAMLVAAIFSPWVQQGLAHLGHFPLHRVFSRITLLGLIAITVWLLVRYGLANRQVLGFALPWPRFLRRAAIGLLAGIVLMAIAILPLFLLHVRDWSTNAPPHWTGWLPLILRGLGSGIAVALIEEAFFRGAMQGALTQIGATRWALFAVPVFYAALHFLGRAVSVPDDQVNAWSGFVAWSGFFAGYAQPLAILDAFIALWCVGLLLALVRRRWGDIAGCMGLHAGFVMTIAVFRKVSSPAPASDWSFLVGSFDGLLGWWIAALTGLACLLVWRAGPAIVRI